MAAAADLTLCVADKEQAVGDSRCLLLQILSRKVAEGVKIFQGAQARS
jgi:hypothetical protein